jgi:microcompartment protein CcmK/EutM
MFLARVNKVITSTAKHPAYQGKRVFVVQRITPDGADTGGEEVAIDYVGSGIGDVVVCGGAPGVAKEIFNLKEAPIRTLIMAIVDTIEYQNN